MEAKNSRTWENGKLVQKSSHTLWLTTCLFLKGQKNPEPYYNEASIFMMTSSFEGWGLTLTEAQQYGCVPLAFHSFASLNRHNNR